MEIDKTICFGPCLCLQVPPEGHKASNLLKLRQDRQTGHGRLAAPRRNVFPAPWTDLGRGPFVLRARGQPYGRARGTDEMIMAAPSFERIGFGAGGWD